MRLISLHIFAWLVLYFYLCISLLFMCKDTQTKRRFNRRKSNKLRRQSHKSHKVKRVFITSAEKKLDENILQKIEHWTCSKISLWKWRRIEPADPRHAATCQNYFIYRKCKNIYELLLLIRACYSIQHNNNTLIPRP